MSRRPWTFEELSATLPDAEIVPIYTTENATSMRQVTGHAAVREIGNAGNVYSVVSDRYQLIRHREVIEQVFEALDKVPGIELRPYMRTSNNGAQIKLEFPFGSQGAVAGRDMVQPMLTIHNSYDLSLQFGLTVGAMRLVCANGLMAWSEYGGATRRHIGNVRSLIEPSDVTGMIEGFVGHTVPLWTRAAQIELTLDQATGIYQYAQDRLKMPKTLVESAENIWKTRFQLPEDERPATAWILYNTFTNAITHNRMRSSRKAETIPVAKEKSLQEVASKLLSDIVGEKVFK